jgi:hypothetical protein
MNLNNTLRFELKFIFSSEEYFSLMSMLTQSEMEFKKAFPDRIVNSIYFDNFSLRNLRDNTDGVDYRSKLRIRWYDQEINASKLEVKTRVTQLISKLSFNFFKNPIDSRLIRCSELVSHLRNNLFTLGAPWFDHSYLPSLFVTYDRQYYQNVGHNIRATVDTNLRFRELLSTNRVFGPFIQLEDVVILELKFPPEDEKIAWEILKFIQRKPSSFSKYQAGWSLFDF